MLVTVAWVLGVLAWVVVLYDAFKRGTGEGLLCLIIPFYALFYVFFRAERKGLALLLLFASAGLGVAGRMGLFGGNDPCKLITKADVEEALGQKMEGPEHSSTRGGPTCSYTTVAEPKMSLMVVVVENTELKSTTDAELPIGAFKVGNLGDDALSNGPALLVQKGTTVFSISWAGAGTTIVSRSQSADAAYGTLEGRKKLARLAIERYKP